MWIECLIYILLHIHSAFTQASARGRLMPCGRGWYYFKDKCYKVGGKDASERLTQEQAAAQCASEHGTLVTIHSKELQELLLTFLLLEVKTNVWIGLNDRVNESIYVWEDGSNANCTNWEPLEPGGPNAELEDCVEMVFIPSERKVKAGGMTGEWNNIPCSHRKAYICESKKSTKFSPDARFCPSWRGGGLKYQSNCYHMVSEKKSWEDAEQHCRDTFNGHLVTISDFDVDIFLDYIVSNFNIEVWIGIKIQEQSSQEWISGVFSRFSKWDEDQDKEFVLGTCALRTKHRFWRKASCSDKHSFICETSKVDTPVDPESSECPKLSEKWYDFDGDYCYLIETKNKLTWYQAHYECMRRGGSLVSIHSEEESIDLNQFVKNTENSLYIGLLRLKTDEHLFTWVDGSDMDYINWNTNLPDLVDENCGALLTRNMKWSKVKCDIPMGYICSVRKASRKDENSTQNNCPTPPNMNDLPECECPRLPCVEIPSQSDWLGSPNMTDISEPIHCPNGVSYEVVIGVAACILVLVILVTIGIRCYQRRAEQEETQFSAIEMRPPPVPPPNRSKNPKRQPKDHFLDDGYYEHMN